LKGCFETLEKNAGKLRRTEKKIKKHWCQTGWLLATHTVSSWRGHQDNFNVVVNDGVW